MPSPQRVSEEETLLQHEPLLSPSVSLTSPSATAARFPLNRSVDQDVNIEDAAVGRNIGWTSAILMIVSKVIGSGVYAVPGSILVTAGSPGMSLVLWIVGALISCCGLAVILEFGTMLPRSGGLKVYLEYVYRKPRFLASTVFAIQSIFLAFSASNCIIAAQYILYALGKEQTSWNQKSLASGMIIVVTIIHGCSVRTGILIQNALGLVKVFLMLFMILTGLAVIITGKSPSGPSQLDLPHFFEGTETNLGSLFLALFKVLYTFSGYGCVNNVMNEVRDPVRTLKSVAPMAMMTITGVYLLLNLAFFSVVPLEEIRNSGQLIAALFLTRVFGDTAGRTILPVMIAISGLGNLFVGTYSESRVNQEIARQGFIPYASVLASNKPFNAPTGGLILHLIPSLLAINLPPSGDIYDFIVDVVGYPSQFLTIAAAIGLLILRKREPNLTRPFRAWTIAAWAQILTSLGLLASPFLHTKESKGDVSFWYGTYAVVGTSIYVFAVLYWYIWTNVLPRWKGYVLGEYFDVLEDGTTITRLVKIYK